VSSVKPRGLWWPYNDGTGSVPMDVGHLSLLARLSAWIICSTHNLTCSEGLLKVSSISGLTGPRRRRHTLMQWFRDPVLPIPEEVCTSVNRCSRIEFRTLSPAEYSKHNSTGFRSGEFGDDKSGVCWTNYRALFRHDIVVLFQQNV